METTVKDLLHAINVIGDDRDVFVDGIDSIAVCPPVKLTPEGLEHFKDALGARVLVEYGKGDNGRHEDTYISDTDERNDARAWNLLQALAGYCSVDNFKRWFEGAGAKII